MGTYTFICLVDGQRVGGMAEATLQEIDGLMVCVNCPHENMRECPSVKFMSDLYELDQAAVITPDDQGVGISIAYLNK